MRQVSTVSDEGQFWSSEPPKIRIAEVVLFIMALKKAGRNLLGCFIDFKPAIMLTASKLYVALIGLFTPFRSAHCYSKLNLGNR